MKIRIKIPELNINITPQMQWEAAIRAADDYCKLMNGHSTYKNATGNIRSSYGYEIKGNVLVFVCGLQLIYSVNLPHVDDGNENK